MAIKSNSPRRPRTDAPSALTKRRGATVRPQRPRLEVNSLSAICGRIRHGSEEVHIMGAGMDQLDLYPRDVTRLRKFLEKCEAYLEAQKKPTPNLKFARKLLGIKNRRTLK